jgi:hypothetical protein
MKDGGEQSIQVYIVRAAEVTDVCPTNFIDKVWMVKDVSPSFK